MATSLGQVGCHIVTRPFFSGRVGSGHETREGGGLVTFTAAACCTGIHLLALHSSNADIIRLTKQLLVIPS